MKFIKIEYTGGKTITDRTALHNTWEPGDTNMVPEKDARTLLRFAEFQEAGAAKGRAGKRADAEATEAARLAQEAAAQADADEHAAKEAMLLAVDAMNKDALSDYARKYDVEIDPTHTEDDVRAQVAGLVEQFGAR